jgi:signal transduction histidine kinase/FixJ family two-component response regulator
MTAMDNTLLLVDDEEDIREVLGMLLADFGYRVLTAENGEEALRVFRKERPPIVLSDIKMPIMDGIDLLRAIKREDAETEVIMVTGHGDMDLAIESLKLEATDFITKPINEDALEIALKRANERISMRKQLRAYTENLENLVREKSARLVEAERQLAVGQAIEGLAAAMSDIAGDMEGGIRYFDEMPCFVSVHDRQLTVVGTNQLYRERLGDRVGANSWEIYTGAVGRKERCPVSKTFRTGRGQQLRETVYYTDGREIPVMVHTAPIRNGDGKLELVLEISADMSEVQRLKEALRTTQERFHQLFDEVPCYISVRDADFRLTAANRRYKEDFDSAAGSQCFSSLRDGPVPCPGCPAKQTFADGRSHQAEMVVTGKSGEQVNVLVWTAPIADPAGKICQVMLMATNITEIRKLENRLTSLGLMMGSLSHAIKGHLTGLDSGMYLLNRGFVEENEEQIQEGWEVVQLIVGRIKRVVLDILYYAKERALQWEWVDVASFAADIAQTLSPKLADAGIEMVSEFDPALGEIEIDPGVVRSAFMNILENALEACLEDPSKPAHRIEFTARQAETDVVFTIRDNGVGMGKEARNNLFTLFFSSKGNRGTGLGLFVANKIIQKHGGTIKVDSESGRGTLFAIRLPRTVPDEAKTGSESEKAERKMLYCA